MSPFGSPCRRLAETESTNDVARDWALAGAPEGAVVVADKQTRGRGRRARLWDSPAGVGLYASFILRPDWPAADAAQLAILGGLAAFHALELAGVQNLRIKWPNDILAGGRKICGVLVEPRVGAERIEFAVVGIGINVGHTREDFPPELRPFATSCRIEGAAISVDALLANLVKSWRRVQTMSLADLRAEWIAAGARDEEPEI